MYCSIQDIENAIGKDMLINLSDDDNATIINETVVFSIIELSSDIIDGYLRGRYSLPLTNSHQILKHLCVNICWYELAKRRSGVGETVRINYEDAISTLNKIQKGMIVLLENDTTPNINSVVIVNKKCSVFGKVNRQYKEFLK